MEKTIKLSELLERCTDTTAQEVCEKVILADRRIKMIIDADTYTRSQLATIMLFVRLCARLGVELNIVYNEEEIDMF